MKKDIEKIVIYIDGGSRGNPGPSAFGILISDSQKNILWHFNL